MAYSGVTATQVLRYINRNLGAVIQDIELSEEEIMRVVFQESLITFSKFFPYKYRMFLLEKDMIDVRKNLYRIPNTDRLEIIGIHKVFLDNSTQYGSTITPLNTNPISNQLFNDYISMAVTPLTWEFYQPNEIMIYPKIANNRSALIEVKAYHPTHMRTIGMDMRDEFLRLCLLDVLVSLYPIRHRFESFNTPYGTIQPFMEMVDRAESERADLLQKFRTEAPKDSTTKRIYLSAN